MFKTLTPIFSILIALGLFFFVARPMLADIRNVQDETNEYREAVEKATEFNQLLQNLLQKKRSFGASELERLDALVPESINETKLLVDIEELAVNHNMLFGNVMVEEGDSVDSDDAEVSGGSISFENDFVPTDISFSVIGTYDDFKSLLAELEKSLTMLELVKLSFETTEGEFQQYDFTVRAYSLRTGIE